MKTMKHTPDHIDTTPFTDYTTQSMAHMRRPLNTRVARNAHAIPLRPPPNRSTCPKALHLKSNPQYSQL